mmetsp:Transcript_47976/g.114026  ORF Transcript_47976/g.114026 Transcript_47976/m.114026 type:complete len:218 (-) Transcript_47976:824-1477(-)
MMSSVTSSWWLSSIWRNSSSAYSLRGKSARDGRPAALSAPRHQDCEVPSALEAAAVSHAASSGRQIFCVARASPGLTRIHTPFCSSICSCWRDQPANPRQSRKLEDGTEPCRSMELASSRSPPIQRPGATSLLSGSSAPKEWTMVTLSHMDSQKISPPTRACFSRSASRRRCFALSSSSVRPQRSKISPRDLLPALLSTTPRTYPISMSMSSMRTTA